MNQDLPYIPERTLQPRDSGLTMMMDKGLSIREAENFVSSSAIIPISSNLALERH